MNALSIAIMVFLSAVVLVLPRRWALLGMMAGVLYLTQNQAMDVAGFNLFAVRFLEIAGFARVIVRREFNFSNLDQVDRLFLLLYCYTTVVFLLRSTEGQAYQIGMAVDAALCYFIFRGLIEGADNFRWFLRAFAILLIPYVALLCVEMRTGHNPFMVFGGEIVQSLREGKVRCAGSFRHPSLLGTLGASFLPLYVGAAIGKADRIWGFLGIILCIGIVFFSNSGGPIAAAVIALTGWFLWPMRTKMQLVRRGMLGLFILLAFIMKAPVWFLPAKFSNLTGGDGWHRSHLMDMAVKDLGKWWFSGVPIAETADWFPYNLRATGGADITNQYLSFGLAAGLVAIVIFVFLLIKCYKSLGEALRVTRSRSPKPAETELLLWGLGAVIAVHIENWFGIAYFDQTYVLWFMHLAAVVSISSACLKPCPSNDGRAADARYAACQPTPA